MRRRLALGRRRAKAADQEAAAKLADDKCARGEMNCYARDGGGFLTRLVIDSVGVFGIGWCDGECVREGGGV